MEATRKFYQRLDLSFNFESFEFLGTTLPIFPTVRKQLEDKGKRMQSYSEANTYPILEEGNQQEVATCLKELYSKSGINTFTHSP